MQKTTLIIARHGNTFNANDTVTRIGKTDLPLVESGLAQGRDMGVYLRGHHLLPDVIFTSTLKRTLQTAGQLAITAGISVAPSPLAMFNEIDYGADENQPEAQVVARIGKEALQKWDKEAIVPQGWQVNPQEIIANWQHFAHDIVENHAGKTVLVVTSNGIARFAPYLTGDFAAFCAIYPIKVATGALCLFEYDAHLRYWKCLGWNIKPLQGK